MPTYRYMIKTMALSDYAGCQCRPVGVASEVNLRESVMSMPHNAADID